jgi:hypothetical protein
MIEAKPQSIVTVLKLVSNKIHMKTTHMKAFPIYGVPYITVVKSNTNQGLKFDTQIPRIHERFHMALVVCKTKIQDSPSFPLLALQ